MKLKVYYSCRLVLTCSYKIFILCFYRINISKSKSIQSQTKLQVTSVHLHRDISMYREFIPKCPEDTKLSRHFINLPQVSIVHLEVSIALLEMSKLSKCQVLNHLQLSRVNLQVSRVYI